MQQNISEMMAAGFEIENLAIDHVRNESEWMPVVCVGVSKYSGQSVPGQARID